MLRSPVRHVDRPSGVKLKVTRLHWAPGFQLLATYKQACAEFFAFRYASNLVLSTTRSSAKHAPRLDHSPASTPHADQMDGQHFLHPKT